MLGAGYEEAWVRAGAVRTHYLQAARKGADGPAVLLLHGRGPGVSAETEWHRLIPLLSAAGYRVFAPDQLGHGYTETQAHAWPRQGHQSMVDHNRAFLDALGLDSVLVLGNSMGAYLAAKLALDDPARIRGLALIASLTLAAAMEIGPPPGAHALPDAAWTRDGIRRALLLQCHNPAAVTDALVEARFAALSRDGVRQANTAFAAFQSRIAGDPELLQRFLLRRRLPHLSTPMLALWGEQDRIASPAIGRQLQALLPGVPFHFLPDAGHLCHLEQALQVAARLLPFFHDLAPSLAPRPSASPSVVLALAEPPNRPTT